MPTYDYECRDCNHNFERFQRMSDDPIKDCPECKGDQVRRLIGAGAGLIFKGSGFYITDYRSKGYNDAKKKAETSSSSTPSSANTSNSSSSASSSSSSSSSTGASSSSSD